MNTYAVIDIGTNSVRLMIADALGNNIKTRMKTLRMVRVGEGMTSSRRIADAAFDRAKRAISDFVDIATAHDTQTLFCFATSAVRDAVNKDDFVQYIKSNCGVEIEIISGDREADLGFAGCIAGYGGMFDIGGGSTEVMVGSPQDVAFKHSFQLGTVRSLQMFPTADEADTQAYEQAHRMARNTLLGIPHADGFTYVGIGGTATALAAIDLELKEYDPAKVQGHTISIARAEELCAMLESKTKLQRKEIVGLEDMRADVIVFGAIIMLEFMRAAHADAIEVSDRDNLEGFLAMKLAN